MATGQTWYNKVTNNLRHWHALVIGRAGLDLYPQPDGGKTRDATGFSADMGGSGGNIAAAVGRAGGNVALLSALSNDPAAHFVRQRLQECQVSTKFLQTTKGGQRTSLAIAEVRPEDCEVVIYRNDAADLALTESTGAKNAIKQSANLIITGTSLISEPSRSTTLAYMAYAKANDCLVWLDLDYRAWNWPSLEVTREIYSKAADFAHVIIGNEEEFAVLTESLPAYTIEAMGKQQTILLKRGHQGATLFHQQQSLNTGIYPVKPLKPYGAGDAFLGNLVYHYSQHQDWQSAIAKGSAAAALVVAQRGCASVMPTPEQTNQLQDSSDMVPAAQWS
ncbi:MAG: hypothetical protein GY881_13575 [Gammaproteobacteria bacterium]|nr:hypothetical protein [Gammaproteobacteria bacterium]